MRRLWSHLRRKGYESRIRADQTDRTEFEVVLSYTDDLALKAAWSEDVKILCKALLDYLFPQTGSGNTLRKKEEESRVELREGSPREHPPPCRQYSTHTPWQIQYHSRKPLTRWRNSSAAFCFVQANFE